MGVHHLHEFGQNVGVEFGVVAEKEEKIPLRVAGAEGESSAGAFVGSVPDKAGLGAFGRQPGHGVIRGGVIHDEDFPVGEGLGQTTPIAGDRQIGLVPVQDDDGDAGWHGRMKPVRRAIPRPSRHP